MKRTLNSSVWVLLAAGWSSAFCVRISLAGGVQWVKHTGQLMPVALNVLMAMLCAGAAIQCLRGAKVPVLLAALIGTGAMLHLLNILGMFSSPSNPLRWLAATLPTNSYVLPASLGSSAGLVAFWLLPIATLGLAWARGKEEPVDIERSHHDA